MEWGTSLEDLEDSQDFSYTSYDMLCNQPFTRRAERAKTLQHSEFFEACLSHGKFSYWRCLLDGFLQKVRDKCGLDTSFGQANIKHYRKDAWGKMRYRKHIIGKLWGLPLGNAVSNGSRFIDSDILPNLPGVAS